MFSQKVRKLNDDIERYHKRIEKRMSDIAAKEPAPTKNNNIPVYVKLITLIADRAEMGKQKHGTHLQANNGRNAMMDALQESIDLNQYLMQKLLETEAKNYAEEERHYTFPISKFAYTNNVGQQYAHMATEAQEFIDAHEEWVKNGTVKNGNAMEDEATDFVHSRETLCSLSVEAEEDVAESERRVWNKNSERGYYGV